MKIQSIALSAALLASPVASAALIANFTMPGTTSVTDANLGTADGIAGRTNQASSFTGLSVSLLNKTGSSGELNLFAGNPDSTTGTLSASLRNANVTDEQGALGGNRYFQFTLTPDPGFSLNLDSLEFDWRRGGTSNTRGWATYYSTDGFAAGAEPNGFTTNTVRLGGLSQGNGASDSWNSDVNQVIGATGIADPVTFRFYVYTPGQTGLDIRFDNIEVRGNVVPEPSIALLGALGLPGLLRRRR